MAPRFSVLLPTHNRADVLGFAIASVLAQSEPDFELLVVADGCTDDTAAVVSAFGDPRIRFFNLPKAPHFGYANRNIALRAARGRLVAFAAHDDLLLPDHLALMGALLERQGTAWGYSRPLWVSTDGVILPFCTNLGLDDERRDFFERGNTIPAACIVHTYAALEQAGFWPEDVPSAADWVLWRRMLGSSSQAAHLRQPTNLHFSANWKHSRFAASEDVRHLLGVADTAHWWPAILRHTPAAEPEQATLWRALRTGGTPWVADLRAAIDTVVDRIAWTTVRELLPGSEAARIASTGMEAMAAAANTAAREVRGEAEAARMAADIARTEAAAARSAAAAAQEEIAALRASTSWRITLPLRHLGTLLHRQRMARRM